MRQSDHYPPLVEWRRAMEAALKRTGKRLFESGRNTMGGYYPNVEARAWCCGQFTPGAYDGSKGPQKVKAHLRTANHFREWCIQHKELAAERFPEVKPLFAEFELTRQDRKMPEVVSTTSLQTTYHSAQNLPKGHGIP